MPLPKSAACPSFSHEFEKEDKPMAKPYKIPDFRKLYPEASEEVIAVLRTTERKMQYQEYDLKTERTIIDHKTQTVQVIPSREDSYERLLEQEVQFEGEIRQRNRSSGICSWNSCIRPFPCSPKMNNILSDSCFLKNGRNVIWRKN